ncbi:class I adenylate-forming enzyme family protein [Dapis sp. BLCC M229]|uniref:class I adenylate-forming enzyme family protein n=1 Tax=Dapis sp. BLCC M229 TaxID=3400188 RepID=UPI003CF7E060
MSQRILTSLLWQAAERWPNRVYLDGEHTYTYAQAVSAVYQLAKRLESVGVQRWDRVLIVAQNRPEILLALFAANVLGATATILHQASTEITLKNIHSQLQPQAVLLDDKTKSHFHCFQGSSLLDISVLNNLEFIPFEQSLESIQALSSKRGTIDTDPALIIYTSGSTGKPRGVVLTQDNILFVVEKIQKRLGYSLEDSIGLFLPLSFDYGLYQGFLAAQVGARLIVNSSELAGPSLIGTLRKRNINILPGVPNLFESLLKMLERRQEILPEIRLATNTGAHLSEQHILRLQNALPQASIYPMYGLTECKRVSILSPEEAKKRPGSVGRPLDDTDAFVIDDLGNRLSPGQVGELVVCGRHLALGYWKATVETEVRYRPHPSGIGRALYTGDNFKIDEEGYLYFAGRKDEQIKRRGFRLHPLEIEKAALELEEVKNAAVIQLEEHLILFIITAQAGISQEMILSKLSEVLESYKIPDFVEILENFPNTLNGKVNQRALEEIWRKKSEKQSIAPLRKQKISSLTNR